MTNTDCTAYGLHWVRATMPYKLLMQNVLPHGLVLEKEVEFFQYGHYNYNRHWATPCGNIYWHDSDPRQKILLDITGEHCDEITRRGLDHYELLCHIHNLGGRVGRVDFAADYLGESSPDDIYWDWLLGETKTIARNEPKIDRSHDVNKGYTLDFGTRESSRNLRIYDRAAKLKAAGVIFDSPLWTRVELESKQGQASVLAQAMREYGIVSAGKKALRAYIKQTSVKWLQTLLEGDFGVYIAPVGRKDTDPFKWHMQTTLPALDTALESEEPIKALKMLEYAEHIVRKHRARIRKELKQMTKLGHISRKIHKDID